MSFAVGQVVVWVPNDKRQDVEDVKVTHVGRRWVSLSNGQRIDINTMLADPGRFTSDGRIYLTRAEYEAVTAAKEAWRLMHNAMGYAPPPGVTATDIKAARKLLRI